MSAEFRHVPTRLRLVKHLSAGMLSCEAVRGGKFNTTYRVRTESPLTETILRLAPVRQDLLYRFERGLLRFEATAYVCCRTWTEAAIQWSKGEYTGSNNRQDDLSIISRSLAFKVDDITAPVPLKVDRDSVSPLLNRGLVNDGHPYAAININDLLLHPNTDACKRHHLTDFAWDAARKILYATEKSKGEYPVVHVWKVADAGGTYVPPTDPPPSTEPPPVNPCQG